MKTNFYLARHGDVGQGAVSSLNSRITPEGKKDMTALAELFVQKKIKFDVAYCSDLIRVQESIGIILDLQPDCQKVESYKLREKDFMELVDCDECDKMKLSRGSYLPHKEQGIIEKYGCESTQSVFNRAIQVKEDILKNHKGKNVLVVSSGGFLMIFQCVLNNMSYEDYKTLCEKDGGKSISGLVIERGQFKLITAE